MLLCTSVVHLCHVITAHTSRLEPLLHVVRSSIDWLIAAFLTHSDKLFMHSQNENKKNNTCTCIYKPFRNQRCMGQPGFHFWLSLEKQIALCSGCNVHTLYRWLQKMVMAIVFNATFNNTSVISWRSVLLVEDTNGGDMHQLHGYLLIQLHTIDHDHEDLGLVWDSF
jgi:hypothetical protein